eukprot:scaffold8923_cov67-Phaeocystis_antarctica.AAC.11
MDALRALPRHARHGRQSASTWVSESRFKTHICRRVVKDVAVFKVRRSALFDQEAATLRAANQLGCSARQDGDDAPRSHGVEYDASSHLRLDRQASLDAQCRAATTYLVGQQLVASLSAVTSSLELSAYREPGCSGGAGGEGGNAGGEGGGGGNNGEGGERGGRGAAMKLTLEKFPSRRL